MNRITPSLRAYVEGAILPLYDHFDAAHRRDHALMVIQRSLALCTPYDVRPDMVYAIAAYHDAGLGAGRERHHTQSARIIRADRALRQWFTQEEIDVMADAAEDHRASARRPPRTIYGRLVAEADRNIEPLTILRRTLQYGLDHYPSLPREAHLQRAVAHLREKYGQGGYLRLWIPDSKNEARLIELRALIADTPLLQSTLSGMLTELGMS